jgi:hypothetical protein
VLVYSIFINILILILFNKNVFVVLNKKIKNFYPGTLFGVTEPVGDGARNCKGI